MTPMIRPPMTTLGILPTPPKKEAPPMMTASMAKVS